MYEVERVEEIQESGQRKNFSCDVCDVKVSNYHSLQVHLNGKKHKARTQPKEKFRCDVCDMDVNGELQLKIHLKGKKHRNALRGKNRASPVSIWLFILYSLYITIAVDLLSKTTTEGYSLWNVFGFTFRLLLEAIRFLFHLNCYLKWFCYVFVLYWLYKPK